MPMFRKKPIALNCEQYNGPESVPPNSDLQFSPEGIGWMSTPPDTNYYPVIQTLEGNMRVSQGDWIITGVRNEKYPCKDSIFRETYESVDGVSF